MKFKYLKVGLFGLMLANSLQVSASIISYNGYTLNGDVVSKGGLEWLRWTETVNTSIVQALTDYAGDGWSLATNTQVNILVGDFGWDVQANEGTAISTGEDYAANEVSSYDRFIELFGVTASQSVTNGFGTGHDAFTVSMASFGEDADNDGYYNAVRVFSDFTHYTVENPHLVHVYEDGFGDGDVGADRGVALVRAVMVGEPSVFVIISLGIMGLASRRFKKQS